MLNLLRFREWADYDAFPALAPSSPITGEAAYRLYMAHTRPFLEQSGGSLLFVGKGGPFLIGPEAEYWDLCLLVKHRSLEAFMGFATLPEYRAG